MIGSRPVLEVTDLSVDVRTPDGTVATAVDHVSLSLQRGRTIGIVGESGCGKSLTLKAIQGILPGAASMSGGSVLFDGVPVRRNRGPEGVAMIFQDPLNALNPVFTVGNQLVESIRLSRRCGRRAARDGSAELLRSVGISEPARRMAAYPHQLSGGMRQRVMIALALSRDPEVLLADEPTTALDVTVQDQILLLLEQKQRERGLGMLLVSHDIGVIGQLADQVIVMYAGRVVETGPVDQVMRRPVHPYTAGLLDAVPRMQTAGGRAEFQAIEGQPPTLTARPPGCAFAARCESADAACRAEPIPLSRRGDQRYAACVHPHHEAV